MLIFQSGEKFEIQLVCPIGLPNRRSAQAKLPINKCVGDRSAKSIHKAIKTRILPRIVRRIIIESDRAIKIVASRGRPSSSLDKSGEDVSNVSFD